MDNKLTQEYKDNLYEKVLEKKVKRTANRKRLASICAVFIIVACFATYGYTKYEKENYNNYFLSDSENIYIDDEYEYFDDLGIKLEFINTDKDSITIGVNIKYEDIVDYDVNFENIVIEDLDNKKIIYENNYLEEYNFDNMRILTKKIDKDTIEFILKVKWNEKIDSDIKFILNDFILAKEKQVERKIIELNWEKKISIEN